MPLMRICISIFALALLAGCAHSIDITPVGQGIVQASNSGERIKARVGYLIPQQLESLEVTTPGGGGDNVRYFPYRAIEPSLANMLSTVFTEVIKVHGTTPTSHLEGLDYIIEPVIITNSGSVGYFTWPPTNFSVDLSAKIRTAQGAVIATPRVVGVGAADTSAKLSDYGIAGRRAMADALMKMQAALLETALSPTHAEKLKESPRIQDSKTAEGRLAQLADLKAKGLINQEEFDIKRAEILKNL